MEDVCVCVCERERERERERENFYNLYTLYLVLAMPYKRSELSLSTSYMLYFP